MEQIESLTPEFDEALESKTYDLPVNDNIYELKMEAINTEKLSFTVRQKDKINVLSYEKIFNYDEITKIFLLEKNFYNDIQKIFKFCDTALNKGKVTLIPEIENHKGIKFLLKKIMDFEEIECQFYLSEKIINKDEIIQILIKEINEIKTEKSNNKENKNLSNYNNNVITELNEEINLLKQKNEIFEVKLISLVEENNLLRNKITELEKTIKSLESKKSDNNNIKNNINFTNDNSNNINNSSNNNITKNINSYNKEINPNLNLYNNDNDLKSPMNLKYKETITNSHSNSGWLRQFVVFKNEIDNFDYLAYNNKTNLHIDIYRINDKQLIAYLKGHKAKVPVIKYFKKENKSYLLSCDENKIVIIWNLKTYSLFIKVNTEMKGYIWDASVLLKAKGYDLCIFPSNSEKECTRVYMLNDNNILFAKEIWGTLTNKTNFVIPWIYNNDFYLIELCNSKISINSILRKDNYANLSKSPEGPHCCGCLLQEVYLCVTDYQNQFLRIWNLYNKSIDYEINLEGWYIYGIVPWNKEYSIITCSEGLIVIDMLKYSVKKKIFDKKTINLCGIQKINSVHFGESIICSNNNGSIMMFNLK